jgi:hypothetical protein
MHPAGDDVVGGGKLEWIMNVTLHEKPTWMSILCQHKRIAASLW